MGRVQNIIFKTHPLMHGNNDYMSDDGDQQEEGRLVIYTVFSTCQPTHLQKAHDRQWPHCCFQISF